MNRADAPKRISILGATGSIGKSTLDLLARNPDSFNVVAVTAHRNATALAELAKAHAAEVAVVSDPTSYEELKAALAGSGIEAASGEAGLVEAASREVDCLVAGIVGTAGLRPTFAAARFAKRIALANKECLVSAGPAFMREIERCGTELLPVDSEHSAAFQALGSAEPKAIESITLTASGGPFRTFSKQQLEDVTKAQALCHPTWSMGAKITIDSATMMNKGLEMIEAYHLFPVAPDQLKVVVHPQSIVHCLVNYCDGSVVAQMAVPDMRTPIAYALSWPYRMSAPTKRLDLSEIGALTFEAPDNERFPALEIALASLRRGGCAPTILNAANEIAVAAFLADKISFVEIARFVEKTCESAEKNNLSRSCVSLGDFLDVDGEARRLAEAMIDA